MNPVGGGVNNSGTMSVTDSTFSGNSADFGAGITNSSFLTVTCSTFYGNTASDYGGLDGILFGGGGGISNTGTLALVYSTLSGNTGSLGGGIADGGKASIVDTIIAGNTEDGNTGASDVDFESDISGSYNLIGPGGSGRLVNGRHGNIVLKNLKGLGLSHLGDNGGPTQTMALLPNSRAIHAGIAVSGVTTDQRGITRPKGKRPDIGEFEVASSLKNQNPPVVSVQHAVVQNSTFLVLTFSEPMNATKADTLANYRLAWAGATDDHAIPIRSVRYNAASRTVTLRPIQRLPLDGTVLLTVLGTPPGGLTNTSGIFLDCAGPANPAAIIRQS